MPFLILHEEHVPGGWRGIIVIAIMCYLLIQLISWLASRKLKRLPGYKVQRPGKKGVQR